MGGVKGACKTFLIAKVKVATAKEIGSKYRSVPSVETEGLTVTKEVCGLFAYNINTVKAGKKKKKLYKNMKSNWAMIIVVGEY